MDNKKTDKEQKDNRRNNKKKKSPKSNSVLNKGKIKDIWELLDIKDIESDYDTIINKDENKQKQYSNFNDKKEQNNDEKNDILNKEIKLGIKKRKWYK